MVDYSSQKRRFLCRWLLRYKQASKIQKIRLLEHLEKLVSQEQATVLTQLLNSNMNETRYQLQCVHHTWHCVEIDMSHIYSNLGLCMLFSENMICI